MWLLKRFFNSPVPAPANPPPPSPMFREPWRPITWNDKNSELEYIKHFNPSSDEVKHVRILLHGPVGSGKSSLMNSFNNVLQGRITSDALANSNLCGESFTKQYTTYKIKKGKPPNYYPFVLNDTMGLERLTNKGVCADDIKLALKGRVNEGYKFNPLSPLSEEYPGYNSRPTLDDQVHILVCVIPADSISRMEQEDIMKIKQIRAAASDLGIPQMAILTKIDLACPVVGANLTDVYKSKLLKNQMTECSQKVGIPVNCIFPVKNYHENTSLDADMDILILLALRQMLDLGNDFIDKVV